MLIGVTSLVLNRRRLFKYVVLSTTEVMFLVKLLTILVVTGIE